MIVPLHCANGVLPPSGQVKISVPLSVVNTTMVLSSSPMSFSFCITRPMSSSSCAMPASCFRPAVLGVAQSLHTFGERCVTMCMRVGLSQTEERLAVLLGLVDELDREVADLVVDRLHPLGIERAGVFDLLLADLAPARHLGRVVLRRSPSEWTMLRGPTTFSRSCG